MASSSSMPLIAATLGSPQSQKLTQSNFLFWKTLIFPALRGAQVTDLLDGTDAASPKTMEVEDAQKVKKIIPNPDHSAWIARDQAVLSYLINSLSPDILAHIVGLETTKDVWSLIIKMFSTHSMSKVNHLRGALNSTKKGSLTVVQYLQR
jgi:histone deacetylase 1/2